MLFSVLFACATAIQSMLLSFIYQHRPPFSFFFFFCACRPVHAAELHQHQLSYFYAPAVQFTLLLNSKKRRLVEVVEELNGTKAKAAALERQVEEQVRARGRG